MEIRIRESILSGGQGVVGGGGGRKEDGRKKIHTWEGDCGLGKRTESRKIVI